MRRKLRVSTTDSDTRQSAFKSLELAQRIKNKLRQRSNVKVQKMNKVAFFLSPYHVWRALLTVWNQLEKAAEMTEADRESAKLL